jgi:mxaJ protein
MIRQHTRISMNQILLSAVLLAGFFNMPNAAEKVETLKVCADPFMLPFSNNEEKGYENRIAELFAEKLGAELQYTWFPQRMGFIRNTLKKEEGTSGKYACDLVITVPSSFELAATTKPYYTTSYVLVFKKGTGLDDLTDPQMFSEFAKEHKPDIKFGVSDRGPGQLWAMNQGMMSSDHMVAYQGQPGDVRVHPGQRMIEDIAAGKIDAAVIWGPTAGYYAKQFKDQQEFVLLPIPDDKSNREMKYTYSMSMAVRYGEKEWKETINKMIDENSEAIDKILTDYGIPLVK